MNEPTYDHNQLRHVFEDEDLFTTEKMVMLAIFVMGYKSDEELGRYCRIRADAIRGIRATLIEKDWLASPEG